MVLYIVHCQVSNHRVGEVHVYPLLRMPVSITRGSPSLLALPMYLRTIYVTYSSGTGEGRP